MLCHFCGIDPDLIMLVPLKRSDGRFEVFSCLDCARTQGKYCDKHNRPHTGFEGDETTACLLCIEEDARNNLHRAMEVYRVVVESLSSEDLEEIGEQATYVAIWTKGSVELAVLRFVMTMSHRRRVTLDEMLRAIRTEGKL